MASPREPQDRKLPTKRAPRKTTPAREVDTTAPLRAEVDAEETGWIPVPLAGVEYRIRPQEEWRQTTNEALDTGRILDWALDVMPEEDYEAFVAADPTNREVADFLDAMGEAIGASMGESRASRRALARMRRR